MRYSAKVFAAELRFEGFTCQDWERVLDLFQPLRPRGEPRDLDRPQGAIVAVHADGRLRKMLHTQVGRLRLDDVAADWPLSAEQLARRHDASWAFVIRSGALEHVMERLGVRITRHDDFTAQCLHFLELAQQQVEAGNIEIWPHRLQGLPFPTKGMVDRTIDSVCPPGKAMLLGLFDKQQLWTSIALKRGADGFEAIVGPEPMREQVGLLSGDFRRDHRHLARAVSDQLGPLSLGCFADYRTFRNLEVDGTPGAWALAVAVRDVVLYPVPPAMALPLGLDVGRAALSALRTVASRIDATGVFDPALSMLRDVTWRGRKVEEMLGFQPLEILRRLLERSS